MAGLCVVCNRCTQWLFPRHIQSWLNLASNHAVNQCSVDYGAERRVHSLDVRNDTPVRVVGVGEDRPLHGEFSSLLRGLAVGSAFFWGSVEYGSGEINDGNNCGRLGLSDRGG
jgi:hypothetical protein